MALVQMALLLCFQLLQALRVAVAVVILPLVEVVALVVAGRVKTVAVLEAEALLVKEMAAVMALIVVATTAAAVAVLGARAQMLALTLEMAVAAWLLALLAHL